MLGYGHDESAPTPGGMFVGCFVGERRYFTECSQRVHSVYVTYSQNNIIVKLYLIGNKQVTLFVKLNR